MPSPTTHESRAGAAKYLESRVLAASPQELRLMLLDGAIKFCGQGRDALARKDYEQMYIGFTRCRAILVELVSAMKPEPNAELYDRLRALYTFMITHLLESSTQKDVRKADRVLELLAYERETWALLMDRLGEQRTAAAPRAPEGAEPKALSLEG